MNYYHRVDQNCVNLNGVNKGVLKSLNSYISVLHNFGVGKSVSDSQNLIAGSAAVLLETLF